MKRRQALQGCNLLRDKPTGAHQDDEYDVGDAVAHISSQEYTSDDRPLLCLNKSINKRAYHARQ